MPEQDGRRAGDGGARRRKRARSSRHPFRGQASHDGDHRGHLRHEEDGADHRSRRRRTSKGASFSSRRVVDHRPRRRKLRWTPAPQDRNGRSAGGSGSRLSFRDADDPEQALLYRLSGDLNPLHADPDFASMAGFTQGPILHGLCTYGFVARAIAKGACGGDATRITRLDGQFRRPVWPGDTIVVDGWKLDGGTVAASVSVKERPEPVMTGVFATDAARRLAPTALSPLERSYGLGPWLGAGASRRTRSGSESRNWSGVDGEPAERNEVHLVSPPPSSRDSSLRAAGAAMSR